MEASFLQALQGRGPLFDAMLDDRARALAQPVAPEAPPGVPALVCLGRETRWALPLDDLAGVEMLGRWTPVPRRRPAILGLVQIRERRLLLVDLDTLGGGAAPRSPERGGHAVILRGAPVALAIEQAESFLSVVTVPAADSPLAVGITPDGTVLLDAKAIIAEIMAEDRA